MRLEDSGQVDKIWYVYWGSTTSQVLLEDRAVNKKDKYPCFPGAQILLERYSQQAEYTSRYRAWVWGKKWEIKNGENLF